LQAAGKPHVFSTAVLRTALEKGFLSILLGLDLAAPEAEPEAEPEPAPTAIVPHRPSKRSPRLTANEARVVSNPIARHGGLRR
jgi:hypothetical protein